MRTTPAFSLAHVVFNARIRRDGDISATQEAEARGS